MFSSSSCSWIQDGAFGTIVYAKLAGFIEKRCDESWDLNLKNMLIFFGSNDMRIHNNGVSTSISTSLWGCDGKEEFGLILIAKPKESKRSGSVVDLSIELKGHICVPKAKSYEVAAEDLGVMFHCKELGGALCAKQLCQLLYVLSEAMDIHLKWASYCE